MGKHTIAGVTYIVAFYIPMVLPSGKEWDCPVYMDNEEDDTNNECTMESMSMVNHGVPSDEQHRAWKKRNHRCKQSKARK
jgi:hypothetical protein